MADDYQPPLIKRETETKENIKNPDDETSRRKHVHVELVNGHDEENLKSADLKTFTQTDELKIMKPPLDKLDQEDLVLSYQQAKEETGNTEPSKLICPRFNLPAINNIDEIAFQSNSIHSLTSELSDEMDTCNKSHVFVTV